MDVILSLVVLGLLLYFIYDTLFVGRYKATATEFSQCGVHVDFETHKIRIGRHLYSVEDVQGLESKASGSGMLVYIKVDDFKKPIHTIRVMGYKSGERFMQRLSTALRKAGGPSFY